MLQQHTQIRKVSDVIDAGFAAFHAGAAVSSCPLEADELVHDQETHGGIPTGRRVRVGIDWQQIWEIGWHLAEMLETKRYEPIH